MNKIITILVITFNIFFFTPVKAQKRQIDSVFHKGLEFFRLKDTINAVLNFTQVIDLNPRHTDALFNLAAINYQQGNKEKAFSLFQTGAKLGDQEAARLLKQFGQALAYTDTMSLNDMDTQPMVPVKSALEDLQVNGNLNKEIIFQIKKGIKRSNILNREFGTRKKIFLRLLISKDGRLNADFSGQNTDPKYQQLYQNEITSILQKIVIIPGKHQGKEVVAKGLTLPIGLEPWQELKRPQEMDYLSPFN